MAHPKLNTKPCRLNERQAEFLNLIGEGSLRIGKHTKGLDKILSRYFGLTEAIPCPLSEGELLHVFAESGPGYEKYLTLTTAQMLSCQISIDKMLWEELKKENK